MITQLKFGDFSSKDHFVVNKVIRPFYNIETELVGVKNKKLVSRVHKEKNIQVEITLINQKGKYSNKEVNELRDIICREIAIKNTEKLIFTDQPNRYWNATLDGNSDIELINRITGKAVLNFLVPDGVAHESTLTPVTAKEDSEGLLSMEIDYEGTEETPLTINVHNNAETGYLAAIGMHGDENTFLTQLGYVDEADGETRTKAQTIFAKDGGTFTNWKDAPIFYENLNKSISGTMPTTTSFGGWLGGVPTTSTQNKTWYGTCKELILPTAIENPYLWGRAWFETGKMGQTGQWTLAFVDENNKFVAGFAISKSDKVGNNASIYFLANDGNGSKVYKSIGFTPSYWIPPNPYGSQSRDKNRNMFDLRKEGNKITFFWYGSYHSFTIPYLSGKKVKRVQFYTGQYTGRSTAQTQLVSRMGLRDVTVIDLKSQYWQDLPNRFSANSNVIITQEKGMNVIYRDGIKTLEDFITGSDFPVLKPGKNHIEISCSDFTKLTPTVTGTYEKRWL